MKILFVLYVDSQMRHFTAVCRALAERGHQVSVLALKWKRQKAVTLPDELAGLANLEIAPWPDFEPTPSWPYVNAIRATRNCLPFYGRSLNALASQERIEELADPFLRRLIAGRGDLVLAFINALFRRFEEAVPPDRAVLRYVKKRRPDLILVSPLVSHVATTHTEFVKVARRLGIPVGFPVFSWDNLSTKGAIHDSVDRIYVWNRVQKEEAIQVHGVSEETISVHGAWRFDRFRRLSPSITREQVCERFGFAPDRPIVLYLGSSPFVAPAEGEFVAQWLEAVRAAEHDTLRASNILIRAHPRNHQAWNSFQQEGSSSSVAVQPPESTSFFEDQVLYDLIYHAEIVMGINTSAMLEAALLGKAVYSLRHPLIRRGQDDTQHFKYLTESAGGLIHLAESWDELMAMMAAGLGAGHQVASEKSKGFCRRFLDAPDPAADPTTSLVEAVEADGQLNPKPHRPGLISKVLFRIVLRMISAGILPVLPRPELVLMDPSAKTDGKEGSDKRARDSVNVSDRRRVA